MEKRFGIAVVIILLVSILALSVLAASLPSVGGDNNAWGTVLNDFLQVAHDSTGQVKSGYISSSMITDATISAVDINTSAVNGSHIMASSALNVTALSLGTIGGGSINSSSNYTTNVTGLFIGSGQLDLGSIAVGTCSMANITMAGLPANSLCIPVMSEVFTTSNVTNVTVTGLNSSINNCRVAVCNPSNFSAIDPPVLTFTMLVITR